MLYKIISHLYYKIIVRQDMLWTFKIYQFNFSSKLVYFYFELHKLKFISFSALIILVVLFLKKIRYIRPRMDLRPYAAIATQTYPQLSKTYLKYYNSPQVSKSFALSSEKWQKFEIPFSWINFINHDLPLLRKNGNFINMLLVVKTLMRSRWGQYKKIMLKSDR